MESNPTKVAQARQKLADAAKLEKAVAELKTVRDKLAGTFALDLRTQSGGNDPTVKLDVNGTAENRTSNVQPARYQDYPTKYDFVAGQTFSLSKLAAVFIADAIDAIDKEIADYESKLAALLA